MDGAAGRRSSHGSAQALCTISGQQGWRQFDQPPPAIRGDQLPDHVEAVGRPAGLTGPRLDGRSDRKMPKTRELSATGVQRWTGSRAPRAAEGWSGLAMLLARMMMEDTRGADLSDPGNARRVVGGIAGFEGNRLHDILAPHVIGELGAVVQ